MIVDLGFLAYWGITFFHLIPAEYLYSDYANPMMVDWNWSFLPLDLAISASGLGSLFLLEKKYPAWDRLATVSLVLTSVSGLQALAFWVLRSDYNLSWWLPNLFLFVYPLFFLPGFIQGKYALK